MRFLTLPQIKDGTGFTPGIEFVPVGVSLQGEMDRLSTLAEVEWFTNGAEAIGIGKGFVWSVLVDQDGVTHTNEAVLGEWFTGIEA